MRVVRHLLPLTLTTTKKNAAATTTSEYLLFISLITTLTLFIINRELPDLALFGPQRHLLEVVDRRLRGRQRQLALLQVLPHFQLRAVVGLLSLEDAERLAAEDVHCCY